MRALHRGCACAFPLGEERVRLVLRKLGKIWMVRRESGKEGVGEQKASIKGFPSGTSPCEGNRKPRKTCHPGSSKAAFVCLKPRWLQFSE